MQTRRASCSALAVSGEVPLSFQDELAATIHRAFEVAVELAVVEVSKLVSQALGDVREQMQETLQENTILKTRLQSAERHFLRTGKRRRGAGSGSASLHEDQRHSVLPPANTESQPAATPKTEPASRETTLDSGAVSQFKERPEKQDESFCEIREDGIVQSRDLDSSASTAYKLKPDKQQVPPHCQETQADQNDSPMLLKDQIICKKEESPEPDLIALGEINDGAIDNTIRPGCGFNSAPSQVIETDQLSLVQSKLLEDWRPDPDELHSHKNKPVDADHSQRLDASHISLPTDGHPGFSVSFDGLFQSADGPDVHPASQTEDVEMRKNLHTRIHQCKICGHSFSRASDLRRHHSHRHRVRASNMGRAAETTKANKQQLFPPGCSPYHCNECGRDFNRMENLKTHLRIHTGERPYSCSVCGVRFRHSGALTRHFRIHTGEKPYVCGQCGKRFRNCGGLRFHQKSHTRDRHLVINCT